MRALNRVFKGRARGDQPTLPARVKRILKKYGATLLMPGPAGILQYGFQPGNYRESTGQTLASVDQQVGLVVDAAQSPGPELNQSSGTLGSGAVYNLLPPITGGAYGGKAFEIRNAPPGLSFHDAVSVRSLGGLSRQVIFCQAGANTANLFQNTGSPMDISGVSVRELPGIHASQPTSGFQPYLRQSGGVNSWQFDGTDDRMVLSESLSGASDYCDLHAVTLQPKVGASTFADFRNNAGTGTHVGRLRMSNTGVLVVSHMNDAGTVFGANGPNIGNTPVIVGSIRQGISHTVLVDDTEVLSTALSGVYACTHSTLGARGSGTSENMQGYYYGGFILPAVPTPKERAVLTKYLASLQGRNL